MSINKLLQPNPTTTLRSYQHASRIFVDGNYRLSPKYGFLYYVEFDFNPLITNVSNTAAQEMGMIVKSVGLPKFSIDTKVHNAYNRKNIVQNSIKYDPINIVFHDDQADTVRNFWYDYYSFFYRDSDYADATYGIINKYQERPSFDWGYSPRPVASYNSAGAYQDYQYIQAIRIYSLYQKNFSEYELINPTIQSFKHGEHVASEGGGLLEHQMSIQFETVKYQTGYTTQNTAGGYIDLHYDNTPSPIAPPGGTGLIDNGQGGFVTAPDTITDLANFNLNTAGGSVIPSPNFAALNASGGFGTIASSVLSLSAATGSNAGGFALPSLGSLTAGISNSAIVQQQLQSAAINLAGQTVNTLAGGVVKGVTAGLGTQGTQALGLAAAAIVNPSAALATVENMAIKFATGAVTQGVNQLAASAASQISTSITSGLGSLNTSLGADIFGAGTTLTGGVSSAIGDVGQSIQQGAIDIYSNFTSELSSGATINGIDIAL